jgi:bile acid-coenzyme A ligase
MLAAWKLGACAMPLNPEAPRPERKATLSLARSWRPITVVEADADEGENVVAEEELLQAGGSDLPLEDRVSRPGKAMATGGSTGTPKLVVDFAPWLRTPGKTLMTRLGVPQGARQLIVLRLHHSVGFNSWITGIVEDHAMFVLERFDARIALETIERDRITFAGLVPTVLMRLLREPSLPGRDLSSLACMYHTGGPCPVWVKRRWLELMPPKGLWELYGGTEGGLAIINGEDWLRHPGSVGSPVGCRIAIRDDEGRDLPAGEIGNIFVGPPEKTPVTFRYLGTAPPSTTQDGLFSIGDLGWQDHEGYLYIADRRMDLIVTGDANVYPAEVEAVLSEHPAVADVVVVGLPDRTWGKRVHAVIQPLDPEKPPVMEELAAYCKARLAAYKAPKSYEFVGSLPRDEAGKIRRSTVAASALAGAPEQ